MIYHPCGLDKQKRVYEFEPLHILMKYFSCEKYEIILTDYEIFCLSGKM